MKAILLYAGLAAVICSTNAWAWSIHGVATFQSLRDLPEVARAPQVRVESIEEFLLANQSALSQLLDAEEKWAKRNLPEYPALPDALKFVPGGTGAELKTKFLRALRINPTAPLALFLEQIPGRDLGLPADQPKLPVLEAMVPSFRAAQHAPTVAQPPFIKLRPGDWVYPLDVAHTAADEPDFGLDVGLFSDSGTEFGAVYGLGPIPFGNPAYTFSTQAPFHMGFYHEAGVITKFKPALKRTYPEMRIHQYASLAKFALSAGHAYWAFRFAGMGSHYIGDLTQPYHARTSPGVSTVKLLWVAVEGMLGKKTPMKEAVQLVSNRHFTLEKFQYESLRDELNGASETPFLNALANTSIDHEYPAMSDQYPREIIAKESASFGNRTTAALLGAFPKQWVNDPKYVFDEEILKNVNARDVMTRDEKKRSQMNELLADLLRHFGAHTRQYFRSIFNSLGT
jgi:hypothetical protein